MKYNTKNTPVNIMNNLSIVLVATLFLFGGIFTASGRDKSIKEAENPSNALLQNLGNDFTRWRLEYTKNHKQLSQLAIASNDTKALNEFLTKERESFERLLLLSDKALASDIDRVDLNLKDFGVGSRNLDIATSGLRTLMERSAPRFAQLETLDYGLLSRLGDEALAAPSSLHSQLQDDLALQLSETIDELLLEQRDNYNVLVAITPEVKREALLKSLGINETLLNEELSLLSEENLKRLSNNDLGPSEAADTYALWARDYTRKSELLTSLLLRRQSGRLKAIADLATRAHNLGVEDLPLSLAKLGLAEENTSLQPLCVKALADNSSLLGTPRLSVLPTLKTFRTQTCLNVGNLFVMWGETYLNERGIDGLRNLADRDTSTHLDLSRTGGPLSDGDRLVLDSLLAIINDAEKLGQQEVALDFDHLGVGGNNVSVSLDVLRSLLQNTLRQENEVDVLASLGTLRLLGR